jgi:predicted dehydrogenase
MEKVRIGVVGTGTIMRDYHMLTLKDNPRAEVVAAGNLHADSLVKFAGQHSIRRTYTDLERMAQDPEIDAVVIGLPNDLHAPIASAMLEAGKHVLCEKPMALTVAEGRKMVQAAENARRRLMIGHMWRFDHEIRWLRSVVARGILGKIFKVKSHAVWLHDGPPLGSWFVQRKHAGGGALADMGVHAIDTLRYLLGEARPLRVFATTGTYFRDIELDDTANLLVEFEGGVTGFIEAGWYHPYADGLEGHSQVYGSEGYARALPSQLVTNVEGAWSITCPEMPKRQQQCDLPMYRRQMEHFLDCVLHDQEPIPGGCEGLWALRVLEAAYQSSNSGQVVDIIED